MPIQLHQFSANGATQQPGYAIAAEMARQCVDQYAFQMINFGIDGRGGGIREGSCWAAVATQITNNFTAPFQINANRAPGDHNGMTQLTYSIVFGNSRMASINSNVQIPGVNQISNHAERNALIIAADNNLTLYTLPNTQNPNTQNAVLFVQLAPCPGCEAWLNGQGGGVQNAWHQFQQNANANATLHVWFRWPYDVKGIAQWRVWQRQNRTFCLQNINTW